MLATYIGRRIKGPELGPQYTQDFRSKLSAVRQPRGGQLPYSGGLNAPEPHPPQTIGDTLAENPIEIRLPKRIVDLFCASLAETLEKRLLEMKIRMIDNRIGFYAYTGLRTHEELEPFRATEDPSQLEAVGRVDDLLGLLVSRMEGMQEALNILAGHKTEMPKWLASILRLFSPNKNEDH